MDLVDALVILALLVLALLGGYHAGVTDERARWCGGRR